MSAHYQVITEREKEKLIERADHLLALLNPPERKLTKNESTNLSNAAKSLNELIKQIKPITFPTEYYQDLIAQSIPDVSAFRVVGTPAQDALAKAFKQQSVDLSALFSTQKSAFDSFNTMRFLDDEKDDTGNEDTPDDSDEPGADAPVARK